MGNQDWFIFAILFTYLITFLIGLFKFKNKYFNLLFITIACIGYILVFKFLGYGNEWFNTIIAFPMGAFISLNKDRIEKIFKKTYIPILSLVSSLVLYVIIGFVATKDITLTAKWLAK